jgi:hypothetical protein
MQKAFPEEDVRAGVGSPPDLFRPNLPIVLMIRMAPIASRMSTRNEGIPQPPIGIVVTNSIGITVGTI